MNRGTLANLARHLILAVKPFQDAVESPEAFRRFMFRLGWEVQELPIEYKSVANEIKIAVDKVEALADSPTLEQSLDLLKSAKSTFIALENLKNAPSPFPAGVDLTVFKNEITERLFEILFTDYLRNAVPIAYNLFRTSGVISKIYSSSTVLRPSFIQLKFDWERLPNLVSSPATIPLEVFNWGIDSFRFDLIAQYLGDAFNALQFPVSIVPSDANLIFKYLGSPAGVAISTGMTLKIPFFYVEIDDEIQEFAFEIKELPAFNGKLPGIIIQPKIPEKVNNFNELLRLNQDIDLSIKAGTNFTDLFAILIRPDEITVKYPFKDAATVPTVGLGIGFAFHPQKPLILVGKAGETRMQLEGIAAMLGVDFINSKLESSFSSDLKGLSLIISPGQGDSFLRKILGNSDDLKVDVSLGLDWSSTQGIKFRGGGGFEIESHPHLKAGPISIEALQIRLSILLDKPAIKLEAGASLKGELGPLIFTIDGIGFKTAFLFQKGNAGPFDIDLGFKPPLGIGLKLDAGGFKGGGFLKLDVERGEYFGGIELEFQNSLSLKALGILNTKMPDGSDGFSLLILITADFSPIQLGFGFTLNAVGGLLGVNRTYLVEVLRSGVKDGSLKSVLFPQDIVANSSRIIGDLKRIFPVQDGHFLIGPMAKIAWGTPTLVSLELGILIEIPRPGFAILGVLKVVLPTEQAALLKIQVNFLGYVDFEKGQIAFDASLFDSRILTFTLTGDMALRIYWKENANFLLSVGGFHPAYTPPPMDLPKMARLGIIIFSGNPSLRAEAYFAVTSNTVQFGAKAELFFDAGIVSVYGFIGLDVLIQFNPFYFIAQIAAMLAVKMGGSTLFSIRLSLMLEGPTPWHARGEASLEIGFCFFSISVSVCIDVTFGEDRKESLPPRPIMPDLGEAFKNIKNWEVSLPVNSNLQVSLREYEVDGNTLIIHPYGVLRISQKVAPLNRVITKYAFQKPEGDNRFTIENVKIGDEDILKSDFRFQTEDFAPAQFEELTDAAKLSRQSFEKMEAGVIVGSSSKIKADYVVNETIEYEVIYVPNKRKNIFLKLSQFLYGALLGGNAIAKSPLSFATKSPSLIAPPRVMYASEKFVIVGVDNLKMVDTDMIFSSEATAYSSLNTMIEQQPHLKSTIQVIPEYQMNFN
jgi:hypothetical protein